MHLLDVDDHENVGVTETCQHSDAADCDTETSLPGE